MENNTNIEQDKVVQAPEVSGVSSSAPKLSTPVAIIIAGFLIMVGIFASNAQAPKVTNKVAVNDKVEDTGEKPIVLAPVSASDHILGDLTKAEIVIVEFSDLECPYCKTFHSSLQATVAKYPGKIAWVYRHFPLDGLHPKARMEARATECAASIGGNDAFWKYTDMIFATTKSNNQLDLSQLPVFASKIGLDKKAFESCLASEEMDAKVQAQYEDGVRAGVSGTPHSIILLKDGTKIPIKGANIDGLNSAIDSYLK